LRKSFPINPLESIYFGGGTPSLLTEIELNKLFEAIYQFFEVLPNAEVTLEANPDDLTNEKLNIFKKAGINRLSLGIQSFQDSHLKLLNRVHNAQQAIDAFNLSRDQGFSNLSCDLIFGIPAVDHSAWQEDLNIMLKLKPEHISAYCLTIEAKTALGSWVKKNTWKPADDDFAAIQYEMLMDQLEANCYHQYEISNFCLDKKYSRHNSAYWQNKNYLGIGPGAHSYNGNERSFNISNNPLYLKKVKIGENFSESEVLSKEEKINEYIMTSLRTIYGLDLIHLLKEYGHQFSVTQLNNLRQMVKAGLVRQEEHMVYLTRKGKFIADEIILRLFIDIN
jgi:oxygen-independent coproporphyrinogen-3 oxidase